MNTLKHVVKWRLNDKNIPESERTFDSREHALRYLELAWTVYPDMQRCRLSRHEIDTEVIKRPNKEEVTHDQPGAERDNPLPAG